MKVKGLDHIGVAVPSLSEALELFRRAFGLEAAGLERVEEQGVIVAFLPLGNTRLELMEPLCPDSPVGRFLAREGPGVQHLALTVDDLEAALTELEAAGIRLVDRRTWEGVLSRVAFVHPKAACGVLIELCETRGERGGRVPEGAPGGGED